MIIGQVAPVNPISAHAYFDRIQFWTKHPAKRLTTLSGHCGHLYAESKPARFGMGYRQRIDLKRPNDEALQCIAEHDDALINVVEVSLDLIFETARDLDRAKEFVDQHSVRRWHGRTQKLRTFPGWRETNYDAGRWSPNSRVSYREKHSRITGELNCLHMEWRMSGTQSVRRAGILGGTDLINFDFHRFWSKRLLFYTVDETKLGRRLRNWRTGGRSRSTHQHDRRVGSMMLRGSSTSEFLSWNVQELIDSWGHLGLERVLTRVDAQDWLLIEV